MGFRIVVFRQLVFYMFALYFYFAIFCGLIFSTFIMPQLSIGDKSAAVELRKVGLTNRKIANQLNFHHSALDKFFRRYDETGEIERQSGSGRPRKSTERQDAMLENLSLKDRKA